MSETKQRMYIEKDGKEIIFFKDKKTGIIIREPSIKDAVQYYNAFLKDETRVTLKNVIETINHMYQYFRWFDKISFKDGDGNIVPLNDVLA